VALVPAGGKLRTAMCLYLFMLALMLAGGKLPSEMNEVEALKRQEALERRRQRALKDKREAEENIKAKLRKGLTAKFRKRGGGRGGGRGGRGAGTAAVSGCGMRLQRWYD
jgi:hypothetical protein